MSSIYTERKLGWPSDENLARYLLMVAALAVVLTLLYGANGVRGTDQYLYLSDVETLMRGESPVTNIYYPAKLLREAGTAGTPNYFLHNGPLLQVTATLGQYLGAYQAWILLNLIFHGVVASVIFTISRRHTTLLSAQCVTALYLLSPIALWQTLNVLQEQYYAALTALVFLGVVTRDQIHGKAILTFSMFVGVFSHPMFLFLGAIFAAYYIVESIRKKSPSLLLFSCVLLLISFVADFLVPVLFPSIFQPNLTAIIAGSVPEVSSMLWHYSDVQVQLTVTLLVSKFNAAIEAHVADFPIFVFTNIALIAVVGLCLLRFKRYARILVPVSVLLCMYVAMAVLMHPQPRFQQIVSVATFVTIAVCFHELKLVRLLRFSPVIFAGLILGAAMMAGTTRKQADLEKAGIDQLRTVFSSIETDAKIVSVDVSLPMKLSQSVKPRFLLSVMTKFMDPASIDRAMDIFEPDFAIAGHTVDRSDFALKGTIEDPLNGVLYLYQVEEQRFSGLSSSY